MSGEERLAWIWVRFQVDTAHRYHRQEHVGAISTAGMEPALELAPETNATAAGTNRSIIDEVFLFFL